MRHLVALSLLALIAACVPPSAVATHRPSPRDPVFEVSIDAGIIHARVIYCAKVVAVRGPPRGALRDVLRPCPLEAITLSTPWGARVRPSSVTDREIAYTVDWHGSPIDPLDARSLEGLDRGWMLTGPEVAWSFGWQPDEMARLAIIAGTARGIEVETVAGGPPPELAIADFHVVGGALVSGGTVEVVLTLENRGQGAAYRVIALTRSSLEDVHGRQLSFGRIDPGQRETRRVAIALPAAIDDTDTMVVLEISEANHYQPRNLGRRFTIRRASSPARLALRCTAAGQLDGPIVADAGAIVHLDCLITNDGARDAEDVAVSIVGGAPVQVPRIPINQGAHADIVVKVPPEARLDEHVTVALTAITADGTAHAESTVEIVVRAPMMCPHGRLTRAAYRAKLAELKAAVEAGELTQDELDTYDAELVGCLE